jgi:pimeloyl-ACP methyl ester carboxylesterase
MTTASHTTGAPTVQHRFVEADGRTVFYREAGNPASPTLLLLHGFPTSSHQEQIAVRFQYEWRDADGQWWRSHGNEPWEFSDDGLMARREASNDVEIDESDRTLFGPRT